MPARVAVSRSLSPCTSQRGLATFAASKEKQIFKLPDGRDLGYAEFGAINGKPLLYFHGYPSSRLEPKAVESLAEKNGIRIIALDRPGFGISTPQPGRTMLDWTQDVKHFTKGIGLDKFAVMGLSGGGPYAMATAYALPKEQLTSVGLFASGPPWAAGAHQMTRIRQLTRTMALHWPSGLRVILAGVVGVMKWVLSRTWVKTTIENKLHPKPTESDEKTGDQGNMADTKSTSTEDGKLVNEAKSSGSPGSKVDELVRTLLAEPFAQGASAAVEEAKILSDPDWGFKLEDVNYPGIVVWHGVNDKNAPIAMIRYLADKVPGCSLHEFDDTHYSMGDRIEQALIELTKNAETRSENAPW